MIGNDIIDLEQAKQNSRWKEQRFLDKLFSESEQDFILSDHHRFLNIWRLWSMKESAYKIISRAGGRRRFNPKDFDCVIDNDVEGRVMYQEESLFTMSETNQEFIQTIAFINGYWMSGVISLSHTEYQYQHETIYREATDFYVNLKNGSHGEIQIKKNVLGIPSFYKNNSLQKEHLSLAHHGHFAAWAITV